MRNFVKHHWLTSVALACLVTPATALAQSLPAAQSPVPMTPPEEQTTEADDALLGDIVVTAQRRAQSVQDVPVSMTALSGESIRELGITDVQDLSTVSSNLNIKTLYGFTNPTIFLRGVGFNDFSGNAVSAVGLYLDEVYVGPPAAQLFQFYDTERLEVLKGPQGTLYGRNTTGGLINLVSNRPSDELEGFADISYGRFNRVRVEGAIGGPILGDTVRARLSGFSLRSDGYVRNLLTGNRNNGEQAWGTRLVVDVEPAPNFSALLTLSYGRANGDARQLKQRGLFPVDPQFANPLTGQNNQPVLCADQFLGTANCVDALGYSDTNPNPYEGAYNVEGRERVTMFLGSATLRWDLGPATLTSVTGFIDSNRNTNEDTDSSPAQLIEGTYLTDDEQFTQEIRIASNLGSEVNWIFGAYYLTDRIRNDGFFDFFRELRPLFTTPTNPTGVSLENFTFTGGYPYVQRTRSISGFGQADFELFPRVRATIGARYTTERKTIDYRSIADNGFFTFVETSPSNPGGIDPVLSFDDLSGRIALEFTPREDLLLYTSYSRGFKSGGFNAAFATDVNTVAPFGPETLNAYEVGIKSEFLGGDVRFNAAAFIYDYQNLQVFTFVNRNGNSPQLVIDNASDATIKGLEAELTVRPVRGLTALVSAGYLDARYRDFRSAISALSFSGNRLPGSSRFTLSGVLRYETSIGQAGIYGQLDGSYRSRIFFDTANTARLSQPGYALLNARLGFKLLDERLDLSLFANNITDRRYLLDAIDLSSFGLDQLNYAEPRTFGVQARMSF
jgi:iron complex outermembrane recepter protein